MSDQQFSKKHDRNKIAEHGMNANDSKLYNYLYFIINF